MRYWTCSHCGQFTRQIAGNGYVVPHQSHLLAILALGLLVHPFAGAVWAVVWGIHTISNYDFGKWTCTECGGQSR